MNCKPKTVIDCRTNKKIFNVGSMFAGVGGICLGFIRSNTKTKGYNLVWSNEMDYFACRTYRRNFLHELLEADLNDILLPAEQQSDYHKKLKERMLTVKTDILTAGFPCQSFSIAGKRAGFKDKRGNLFWSIIETIQELDKAHGKPRVLFLENVKNLKTHDKGKTYGTIKTELERAGYHIKEGILNAKDFSTLPQNRERIYVVGFLDKSDYCKFTFFDRLNEFKLNWNLSDRERQIKEVLDFSLTPDTKGEYFYSKEKYPNYFLTQKEYERIPTEKRKEFRLHLGEQIIEPYRFYQIRRGMYVRENKNGVCPTLTANMGTGGHNVPLIYTPAGIRKLTPTECFRLQGFPVGKGYFLPERNEEPGMPDSQLYKQAGNSVPVPVVKLIAGEILNILS